MTPATKADMFIIEWHINIELKWLNSIMFTYQSYEMSTHEDIMCKIPVAIRNELKKNVVHNCSY